MGHLLPIELWQESAVAPKAVEFAMSRKGHELASPAGGIGPADPSFGVARHGNVAARICEECRYGCRPAIDIE
jgi:hypothetical protein